MRKASEQSEVRLFLSGDVMTGRGIDQILPHPGSPRLFECAVRSARTYVQLAERRAGAIAAPVDVRYVWGDALAEFTRRRPDARIVNLETAVTTSATPWPDKAIHYRMSPANIGCLSAAGLDCCVLANNHVLDWGRPGLEETLATLQAAGIRTAGAGRNEAEASAPAIIPLRGGASALVFALALESSGAPAGWRATGACSGVNWCADEPGPRCVDRLAGEIARYRRDRALIIVSIHWGGNWGYRTGEAQRQLAHALINRAGVDVVHGHSSHHVKGIEVYRHRLILYGCGDLLDDYEGIAGYESFRPDLGLLYFATLDTVQGRVRSLTMVPTQVRQLRIRRAEPADMSWLCSTLARECRPLGTRVMPGADGTFELRWH